MTTKIKANATVVRVVDGDTLEVKLKVRMADIDAPETKGIEKPLGDKAKEWLKDRIEGDIVRLEIHGNDIYYRLLSDVYDRNDVNVGAEMLEKKLVEKYTPKHHNNGILDI